MAHETWRIIPTHAATGSTRTFITPLGNKSGTASLFVVFVMPKQDAQKDACNRLQTRESFEFHFHVGFLSQHLNYVTVL
jgi:hypothetical protein